MVLGRGDLRDAGPSVDSTGWGSVGRAPVRDRTKTAEDGVAWRLAGCSAALGSKLQSHPLCACSLDVSKMAQWCFEFFRMAALTVPFSAPSVVHLVMKANDFGSFAGRFPHSGHPPSGVGTALGGSMGRRLRFDGLPPQQMGLRWGEADGLPVGRVSPPTPATCRGASFRENGRLGRAARSGREDRTVGMFTSTG